MCYVLFLEPTFPRVDRTPKRFPFGDFRIVLLRGPVSQS